MPTRTFTIEITDSDYEVLKEISRDIQHLTKEPMDTVITQLIQDYVRFKVHEHQAMKRMRARTGMSDE